MEKKICLQCTQEIPLVKDGFQCRICLKRIHIKCAPGTYTQAEIDKFQRIPFHYLCPACTKEIKDHKEPFSILNYQKRVEVLTASHNAQIQEITRKYNEQLQAVNGLNQIIQDMQREINLSKQVQPNKRLRTNDGAPTPINLDILNELKESIDSKFNAINTKIDKLTNNQLQVQQAQFQSQPQPSTSRAQQPNIKTPTYASITSQKPQVSTNIPFSMANAIQLSKTKSTSIRNIILLGTDEEKKALSNLILNDNAYVNINILSIKQKGKHMFTITCGSDNDATELETLLHSKYGQVIEIKTPNQFTPKVKIVRIQTLDTPPEIKNQILEQNKWLNDADFQIEGVVDITTGSISYKNLILTTTLESQQKLLTKGKIVFNLRECKIFDHVNLIQCIQCWKFGHFQSECTFKKACKHCSDNHHHLQCPNLETTPTCINCKFSNAQGCSYKTNHIATYDKCATKVQRINALKEYVSKN